MNILIKIAMVLTVLILSAPLVAVAADESALGFLFTDYSKLEPVSEERPGDRYYFAPAPSKRSRTIMPSSSSSRRSSFTRSRATKE